jgi:hypothetical protein
MIQFELFDLACPPRVGGAWALRAAERAEVLPIGGDGLHGLPVAASYNIGIARHPFTWLQSYYAAGGPNFPGDSGGKLAELVKQSVSIHAFFRNYLLLAPGAVGKAFNAYRVDTILRMEDFPWAMFELLHAVGVSEQDAVEATRHLPPSNPGAYATYIDKELKRKVVKAEKDFCERYEYGVW